MATRRFRPLLTALGLFAAAAVPAQPADAPPARAGTVALDDVLASVADRTGRTFLVDSRAPESIVVAGVETAGIDYPALLAILRNNDLAAVEIDGYVNIVRAAGIRQYPVPIVDVDDDVAADEWVASVIEVDDSMQAAELVPVLRPLLPVEAHFAAHASQNKLIVVDRFGNLQRIAALIESLQ